MLFLHSIGAAPSSPDSREAAWQVLRDLRTSYRMSHGAMESVRLKQVHDIGRGAVLVSFEQEVDGLEVFQRRITVAMNRDHRPLGVSGNFASVVRRTADTFERSPESALESALRNLLGKDLELGTVSGSGQSGRHALFTVDRMQRGSTHYTLLDTARIRQVLFPEPRGLKPAHYLELGVRPDDGSADLFRSYVISASDGEVLFSKDLAQHAAYSYRVWADDTGQFTPDHGPRGNGFLPHPTGTPDGSFPQSKPQKLVTLENVPFSRNDPWLAPGATEARGNNVWAFADLAAPSGFGAGDLALVPSSSGVFDYPLDTKEDTTVSDSARRGAITQLFYTLNYLHDTFYDAGWDESAGNPQQNNYGRGGIEGDPILASGQSYARFENSVTVTFGDGRSPTLEMGLSQRLPSFKVLAPAALARQYQTNTSSFDPQRYDVTADLALVNDGQGESITDGCETPFVNTAAVSGHIAVIDRGTCSFVVKLQNAVNAGAVGAIIVNNNSGGPLRLPSLGSTVTIPSLGMSQSDGAAIKAELLAGNSVSATMAKAVPFLDSSLDSTEIAHEWGHIMSNRLIHNAAGLMSSQSRGLGEGWSDFIALLSLVRKEAAAAPSNFDWNGTFTEAPYSNLAAPDAYYYGSRRYPYSSDLSKNPLTFKHISNGVVLPTVPAPNHDNALNSEEHNTGEIWGSMLWDCYTSMLRDTSRYTFELAQKTMREYLVASLKLTPMNPTFLEARDALLMTMLARDPADFTACAASFARRGAGVGAVAPERDDLNHDGVVESYQTGPNIEVVSYKLEDSPRSCDNDGVIDNQETGRLTLVIRNSGFAPLKEAFMTVSADTPALRFEGGHTVPLPILQPFETGTAQLDFFVKGTAPFIAKLNVTLKGPGLAVPQTAPLVIEQRMNYDVQPNADTTDTFEAPSLGWSTSGDTSVQGMPEPWRRTENPGGKFFIPNNKVPSDQYLISPAILADSTASLTLTFRHRYSFESDSYANYDGAVLEASEDGGTTWTDLGSLFTSGGYNGELTNLGLPAGSGNPLIDGNTTADRPAFVGQSSGYPDFMDSTADLGTRYAGKSVLFRFRVGTDAFGGGPGWEIEQVSLTGLTNKPFSVIVPQPEVCQNRAPVVTVSPIEQTVPAGSTVTLRGVVQDPDADSLAYQWVQTSGPMVTISNPTALLQLFPAPQVSEPAEATFALRASDGKMQSEAIAKITFVPRSEVQSAGCSCRAVPAKQRAADAAWDFMLLVLAAFYSRRKRTSQA